MMVARWSIEARFGHKPEAVAQMKRWMREIAPQLGWGEDRVKMYTGSVGARESTIESDILVKDLAELNTAWEKLAHIEAHRQWSRDLEPYVVSGTPRWEVFRVID